MAEFKLSSFIIIMLLISGLSMGMYGFISQGISSNAYNITNYDPKYQDRYDKMNQMDTLINQTETGVNDITLSGDKSFFTGAFDVFNVARSSFRLAKESSSFLITSMVEDLGFDVRVERILFGVIAVLIIGALIYIITGRDS